MVRIRKGWLAAVAVVAIGSGACKKNDNNQAAGDKASPADKVTGAVQSMVSGESDDLSLLPADSDVVVGINFSQIMQSALLKPYLPQIMAKASGDMADFKAQCGFDPLETLKSVSIGMKNFDGGKPDGALVVHGIDKSKIMACMDKIKADAAKKGTEITQDGDAFLVKNTKDNETAAFTWVNDSTVLGTIGTMGTKDGVMAAANGKAGLKTSPAFLDMFSKVNAKDSIWAVVNGSVLQGKLDQLGVKPKALFGSLNITDGLSLDGRLRTSSPDEAAALVKSQSASVNNPQIKNFVDKLDFTSDGADVKLSVSMSQQKLQQVAQMFAPMLGGLMGGLGGHGGGMGGP